MRRIRFLLAALPLIAALAISPPWTASATERIAVVASFSILADMVARIGGDRVFVTMLVGPDSDAHVYAPTPKDVARVAAARLFVVNGLGFEGWMARLIEASGSPVKPVVASAGVAVVTLAGAAGTVDPHAWHSVPNALVYVANIAAALCDVDPPGCADYQRSASAYSAELRTLDAEIRTSLVALPAQRRRVITAHDAFGYFAATYDVTFLAPEGLSTEADVTAADVARLVAQIRAEAATAVFVENISDRRLIEQIGRDTGASIGGTLYSDALSGADGPAPTFIAMLRHNFHTLAKALAAATP